MAWDQQIRGRTRRRLSYLFFTIFVGILLHSSRREYLQVAAYNLRRWWFVVAAVLVGIWFGWLMKPDPEPTKPEPEEEEEVPETISYLEARDLLKDGKLRKTIKPR